MAKYTIRPPKMRLPRRFRKGDAIRVLVKIRHPSRTGLKQLKDGSFVRDKPPFYLRTMEVFYDHELISTFELTSATSDDPIIGFALKVDKEAPLKVVFTNSQGQKFAVTKRVKFPLL